MIAAIDINALLESWLLKISAALAIFVLGYIAAGIIVRICKASLSRTRIEATILSFVGNVIKAVILILVLVAALNALGVPYASMVAAIGAAGLAIALSLQGSLSNLAAGVLLSIFRPFKVGDVIEVSGQIGVVDDMQILFTRMHTPDNRGLTVPNSTLISNPIINLTAFDTRRLDLTFGISYGDDIDKAKTILKDILASDPRILKDPEPLVGLAELADSSVNFWVRPWVKRTDYLNVMLDLQETVKKRFDLEGISIPFPQRDVHLYSDSNLGSRLNI